MLSVARKNLQSDWSRGVQYISYYTRNISMKELRKTAEEKQIEDIYK